MLRDFHLLDLFTERGTISVGKRSLASAAVGASFRVSCFERFRLGILDWMGGTREAGCRKEISYGSRLGEFVGGLEGGINYLTPYLPVTVIHQNHVSSCFPFPFPNNSSTLR